MVLAATEKVVAGTTLEAAADMVTAHVVDLIGEERLEPATAGGRGRSGDRVREREHGAR